MQREVVIMSIRVMAKKMKLLRFEGTPLKQLPLVEKILKYFKRGIIISQSDKPPLNA